MWYRVNKFQQKIFVIAGVLCLLPTPLVVFRSRREISSLVSMSNPSFKFTKEKPLQDSGIREDL
jgi:hypothetical protein